MLDDDIKQQLVGYLERVTQPFEIVATLGDDDKSAELRDLLEELASMQPDMIALRTDGQDRRTPSFTLSRAGEVARLCFAAIPLGHEFTSLVLALLWTGGHPPKETPELLDQIKALDTDLDFEIYMSLSCHNCPDVVQALALMAVLNPRVKATVIDGGLFPQEIEQREIMGVPTVYLNGQFFANGRMGLEDILHKVDSGAAQRDAARLGAKAPFDVLIIGGGPAGAAAAIYAARKGIRTGLIAERLGGQVNETNDIANYPGLAHTTGPAYAAALFDQVRGYGVDVINAQRVAALAPAAQPGGLAAVTLANGSQLHSRSVIIATGARWRNVGCPGEQEYQTKGVAYCPHCDGPLFSGKDVAVIGGGNSGVEAAIDLAGVVRHVTLLVRSDLRADAVLVAKLKSLPNVIVHTHTQIAEITGAGGKVNGLTFQRRDNGEQVSVPLEGVFVQIGLIPNTEWLADVVERTPQGEIVTDAKGQTSAPGIFAAGDCTTAPYKQIVVAAGLGAAAALSAFDYLIRTPTLNTSFAT
jgi:alkyl hydroperoxide reductase subunit F